VVSNLKIIVILTQAMKKVLLLASYQAAASNIHNLAEAKPSMERK
jgi:hypothetical protein